MRLSRHVEFLAPWHVRARNSLQVVVAEAGDPPSVLRASAMVISGALTPMLSVSVTSASRLGGVENSNGTGDSASLLEVESLPDPVYVVKHGVVQEEDGIVRGGEEI